MMVHLIPRPVLPASCDSELVGHVERTFAFLEQNDFTNAFVEGGQAVRSYPENAVSHYLVGSALMALLDFQAATRELTESIDLDASSAEAHFMLGQAYRLRGFYDQAIAEYAATLKQSPDYAVARAFMGECHRMQGNFWRMEIECHNAMILNPRLVLPHTILADGHLSQGKIDQSLADYKMALKLAPKDPYVHFRFGQSLRAINRLDQAEAELRKAIAIDSTYADALMVLALVLAERKNMSEALFICENAAAMAPYDADVHLTLAYLHTQTGNHEGAVREYKLASGLKPKSLRIQRQLAMALAKAHRLDEAIVELSLVSRQLPLDEDVKLMLGAAMQLKRKQRTGDPYSKQSEVSRESKQENATD